MTFPEALEIQARACDKLGSPFMARLLRLSADRLTDQTSIGKRLLTWPGDIGLSSSSVPLRFAGGLHALKLRGDPDLVAVYPPNTPSDDALWAAVDAALVQNTEFLNDWLNRPPQTNEVRRSAALLPAAALVTQMTGMPLSLIELGASAGLNLNFDRYALETPAGILGSTDPVLTLNPKWHGDHAQLTPIFVSGRQGCDIAPIDPASPAGRLRLLAYLWPDQPDRLTRTISAIKIAKIAVETDSADAFLQTALAPSPGTTRFLYHTVAWQYFPSDVQSRARDLIEGAGKRATPDTPLAWFSMETGSAPREAVLQMRFWPGDLRFDLGTVDFHGRWIDWKSPASI